MRAWKKAVKACRDEGLSIQDACDLHGVKRGTLHNALKGKHQNTPGGMTVFSQTEEWAFVNYLMVVNEWGFPMDEMDVQYLTKSTLTNWVTMFHSSKKIFLERMVQIIQAMAMKCCE